MSIARAVITYACPKTHLDVPHSVSPSLFELNIQNFCCKINGYTATQLMSDLTRISAARTYS